MQRVIVEVEAETLEEATSLLRGLATDLDNNWTFIERVSESCSQKMVLVDPDENDRTAFPEPAKKGNRK